MLTASSFSFGRTRGFLNFRVHLGCFFALTAGPGLESFDSGDLDIAEAKLAGSSAKEECRALSWGEVPLPFPRAHGPIPTY